jgi:hypothetical protein
MSTMMTTSAKTAPRRWTAVVRRAGAGLAAGLVAGVAMGLAARLMMRLATVAAGMPGHFSFAGTAGIVVVFVVVAVPGAILAALMRRRGRSALLVLGALLLAVPAVGIARTDLGHVAGLAALEWVGVGAATLGVLASILALPVVTLRLLARWT